ncbi:MAG: PQQ-binding-like beta-propeller repeat protein, partial [Nannocystaceae bacterium]
RWPGMGSPLGGVLVLDNEVVADGPWLVVATQRRGVVAMSLDGKVRWRYEPQPGRDNPRGTAPMRLVDTEADGRFELLVPLRDGTLYALDAQTGAVRWRMATGDPNIEAAPVAVDLDGDGALEVLLAGHDRQLLAIRPPRNDRR